MGFVTITPGAAAGGVMLRASICLSHSDGTPARSRFARAFSSMSPEMSLPKISRSSRLPRAARFASIAATFSVCHAVMSYCLSFSKPKRRSTPGATPSAICAASATNVPLPHIGS